MSELDQYDYELPRHLIAQHPAALQLRYLQTIREIGVSGKNSTLIPVPMELLKNILP